MKMLTFRERNYIEMNLRKVVHTTLDPRGPGVVRIHMVPPKNYKDKETPYLILLNGQDLMPISVSWAILLSAFIKSMNEFGEREISPEAWDGIIQSTCAAAHTVYPRVKNDVFKEDLHTIIDTLTDVARGMPPKAEVGVLSLGDYAPHMLAPHRMDLLVSAMTKDGQWNCNQRCIHCYAAGQPCAEQKEMNTAQWVAVIAMLRDIGIPQLTFTGGEPTLRADLPVLVGAAKWFVTRLNTNGVLLSKELCAHLVEAELDSAQVTVYSHDANAHNKLVGAENFDKTIAGLKNALASGLSVSVNTPLCSLNRDYVKTLEMLHDLGVRYVTCSGLICTGSAEKAPSVATRLDEGEMVALLTDAFAYTKANGMEISFTSPGWVKEETLRGIGFTAVPSCGACLSNMAIAPNGDIMPCQSWLSDEPLGSILRDDWKQVWEGQRCASIRNESAKMAGVCPLRERQETAE